MLLCYLDNFLLPGLRNHSRIIGLAMNAGHSLGKFGHRQISLKGVSVYRVDLSWLPDLTNMNCSSYIALAFLYEHVIGALDS